MPKIDKTKAEKAYIIKRVMFNQGKAWIGGAVVGNAKEKKFERVGFRIVDGDKVLYWLDFSPQEAHALIECLNSAIAFAYNPPEGDIDEQFMKMEGVPEKKEVKSNGEAKTK